MRRALAVLVAAVVGFTAGCTGDSAPSPPAPQVIPVADRAAAPTLRGEGLDGRALDLADRAGQVIVVNFWGSWCAPCVAEVDDLEQVYRSTKDTQVAFVGVNVRDVRADAQGFVAEHKVTYPNLFDPASRLALGFAVPPTAIPSTIIIDRQGRVALTIRRAVVRAELEPLVAQVAAEKP